MDTIKKPKDKKTHIGENIRDIRKVLGMNQRDLCEKMKVAQQTVSMMENSEEVDEELLKKAAEALGVPVEVIKTYDHDDTINYIVSNNTVSSENGNAAALLIDNTNINNNNPLDKIVELYEKLIAQQKEDYTDLKNQLNGLVDELYNLKRGK